MSPSGHSRGQEEGASGESNIEGWKAVRVECELHACIEAAQACIREEITEINKLSGGIASPSIVKAQT